MAPFFPAQRLPAASSGNKNFETKKLPIMSLIVLILSYLVIYYVNISSKIDTDIMEG
jgi:hypothetical protein